MAEVPHHFHFVFGLRPQAEAFHVVFYLCLESCRRINRPAAMHLYYHYEPYGEWWERIRPYLTLHRVEPVDFVTSHPAYWRHQEGVFIKDTGLDYAHQCDFLRLEILAEHGGVYADIDTLFVRPLPESLFEQEFVLGTEGTMTDPQGGGEYESLCNAFIMARPGARFAARWLADMYELFDGTWNLHSCYGASRLRPELPDALCVVPRHYFYPYRWTREDLALLLEGFDDERPEDMLSIHLWNHLWWEPARTDFSSCHKGVLTEEYIRTVDTTYNVLARGFLD